MRALTTKQAEAVEKFRRLKVGALFMACGTGKTQAAVSIVNSVDDVALLYWLCPCRVKETLRAELAKCGCRYTARIVGIESIGCSDRIYLEERQVLETAGKVFMVCDESIKVKNLRAKRTCRILALSQYADYRLILNGTPVTKNILDIYAQMRFLSPKILPYSLSEFRNRYCQYYQVKQGCQIKKTVVTGYANVDHLLSVIRPYVYQCELELKIEKRYHTRMWAMNSQEASEYQALKDRLFIEYQNYEGEINMLAIFSRLQHAYALSEQKWAVLDAVLDERTIVFCKYKVSEAAVRERYPHATVMTYGKGAFGLNLQKYRRIVYFDKTFDYSFREQSEGRIYRNGQTLD
ncbi:MAG: SNF2-related protein, partial [Candidatus Spyradenecus sp.]